MAKYFAHKGMRSFRFHRGLQGREAWGPERHQQHVQALHRRGDLKTPAAGKVKA